jgi:GMP synthase (glutamine-hydrolysing)
MSTGRVLIIQNDATENLCLYETFLKERVEVDVVYAYSLKTGESFPAIENYSAFVVGPTPISANDVNLHPFLVKEWKYLSKIIVSEKPTLGVCCGGQILARLLGAKVVWSPSKEVGVYTVKLTEQGRLDDLFKGFPMEFPVFHWHNEMFNVPPEGSLLVKGNPCPIQAYSWRSIRGVIFHLEIDHREAERWTNAYPAELEAVSKTKKQVVDECREREPEMRQLAERLVENFLLLGQ